MNGRSISGSFEFQEGGTSQNVCDLLDDGVNNGFTVSTYSAPQQILKSYAEAYSGSGLLAEMGERVAERSARDLDDPFERPIHLQDQED